MTFDCRGLVSKPFIEQNNPARFGNQIQTSDSRGLVSKPYKID